MKATLAVLTLAVLTSLAGGAGAAHAAGCSRLSWGTCDPWVENMNFSAPTSYVLVWSITGTSDPNTGTDGIVHIGGFGLSMPAPDCWRFDDAGCQTASQLHLSTDGFSKSCAAFKGTNNVTLTSFTLDPYGQADLRLSDSYDLFTPVATSRYAAWVVTFDHSFSSTGPTPPDQSTCGGAEICENLSLTYANYLTQDSQLVLVPSCDTDPSFPAPFWSAVKPGAAVSNSGFVLWNGGCIVFDATHPPTWGRVKGLYR